MSKVLPDEILFQVFGHLDPLGLVSVLQCNHQFHRIATTPALWETPFYLRWSHGDEERERKRGTAAWRRAKRLSSLRTDAIKAATHHGLDLDPTAPFKFFKTEGDSDLQLEALDFHGLFCERITLDQKILDHLYQQVESTHNRISTVAKLVQQYGNDAKDILGAIVAAQSSCPSESTTGLPLASSPPFQQAQSSKGKERVKQESTGTYRITAYQAHSPTTLRSDSHHLVLLHYAREALEHLQRREAMARLTLYDDTFRSHPTAVQASSRIRSSETETAVSLLTMFRGGEASYVEHQLDLWAAACDLYLQQTSVGLDGDPGVTSSRVQAAKSMTLAICDFLVDHGFRGARADLFQDLDNHFLHFCFTTNRETLPLSLTLIFCGIANRLGLDASLCNFPMRILAVVRGDRSTPLPGPDQGIDAVPADVFWIDIAEYTSDQSSFLRPTAEDVFHRGETWTQRRPPILEREDLTRWTGQMGMPLAEDFWRPTAPHKMVTRAARNIVSSVQRAQILPRTNLGGGGASRSATVMERNRRLAILQRLWTEMPRVDFVFLNVAAGSTGNGTHSTLAKSLEQALRGQSGIAEEEASWKIARQWRSESLSQVFDAPFQLTRTPADLFSSWIETRVTDNDWSRSAHWLMTRAELWSEYEQQAAMYAAANGFIRLSGELGDRGADWIAGLVQSYFILDVDIIENDFLGTSIVPQDSLPSRMEQDEEGFESGSDSSNEASFSAQAERHGTPPPTASAGGMRRREYVRNLNIRSMLRGMLQDVRSKDSEPPKVNHRPGADIRKRRERRATRMRLAESGKTSSPSSSSPSSSTVEEDTTTEGNDVPANTAAIAEEASRDEYDPVGYRVGTIFKHRTYGYVGCILGWDPHCAAPEEWILNMGVDRLPPPGQPSLPGFARRRASFESGPVSGTRIRTFNGPQSSTSQDLRPEENPQDGGEVPSPISPESSEALLHPGVPRSARMRRERRGGRHQPFYHSQVADGTRRYVAEVNVDPILEPVWVYGIPGEVFFANADIGSSSRKDRPAPNQRRLLSRSEDDEENLNSIRKLLGLRGLGEYFRCFDPELGRMRRNKECRAMFPDDWSDDDDDLSSVDEGDDDGDDENKNTVGQASKGAALNQKMEMESEKLSEDGNW